MKKKIFIAKNADVQTALRISSVDHQKLEKLAQLEGCTIQDVIRFIITDNIDDYLED